MSVLLRTVNPQAADALGDGLIDRRIPYVGQVLIYHCRPGEGRGGLMSYAGICTRVEADGDHTEMLCVIAADDFISRWKVPRRTEQNPVNAWSFNEWDEVHYRPSGDAATIEGPKTGDDITWDTVREMYAEMGSMRRQIAGLLVMSDKLTEKRKSGRPQKGE